MIQLISLLATCVILTRCICMAAQVNKKEWSGHPLQFIGFAVAYGLSSGGSLGVVFGWQHAPIVLLLGVAGWVMFDRRNCYSMR